MASFISLKRLCEFLASFFRWIWDLRASINIRGLSMMAFLEARLIGDSKANDYLKDATIMNACPPYTCSRSVKPLRVTLQLNL